MPSNTMPIVGAFYRPPAKALIDVLPIGTPLQLIAEPENPYDPNAVAVYLASEHIPEAAKAKLEETLPLCGFSVEAVMEQQFWHLGYVPKEMASKLRDANVVADEPVDVTFSTSTNGAPRVRSSEPFPI
jgi:hypothetical protein